MEVIPLLEFDDDKTAIVEPTMVYKNVNPPEHCVMPIYRHVIVKLRSDGRLDKVFELETPLVPIDVYNRWGSKDRTEERSYRNTRFGGERRRNFLSLLPTIQDY